MRNNLLDFFRNNTLRVKGGFYAMYRISCYVIASFRDSGLLSVFCLWTEPTISYEAKNYLKIYMILLLMVTGFSAQSDSLTEDKKINILSIVKPPLDRVTFQISGKQWIKAEKALLLVNVSAAFNSTDLIKARMDILTTLNKIAPGEWHITEFNRGQESSGLDKLDVLAEARVKSEDLTNIFLNAKNVSKPGIAYSISKVEFKPSLEEEQAVRKELRSYLYQQINLEIADLNKALVEQHYTLHRVEFFEGDSVPLSRKASVHQSDTMLMMNRQQNAPPSMGVSNELILHALVELASNRIEGNAVKAP